MGGCDVGSQVPRIGKMEIVVRVDELLGECWDGVFPVDVENVCDYLGLVIVPVVGLESGFGMDAFIAADFGTIYVDDDEFRAESNRYRFSVAHEIGHFVLHREYFAGRVGSLEEWSGAVVGDDHGYVEYQANYFAGCLLAPEEELVRMLNTKYDGSFAKNYYSVERGRYAKVLAEMRRWFMVSEQVVARRMRDVVYGLEVPG